MWNKAFWMMAKARGAIPCPRAPLGQNAPREGVVTSTREARGEAEGIFCRAERAPKREVLRGHQALAKQDPATERNVKERVLPRSRLLPRVASERR